MGKERKSKKKGKRVRKGSKHCTLKPHTFYDVKSGAAVRLRKHCPRCGPGTFMADHKGRLYCGRCQYTELEKVPEGGARPSGPKLAGKPAAGKPQEKK